MIYCEGPWQQITLVKRVELINLPKMGGSGRVSSRKNLKVAEGLLKPPSTWLEEDLFDKTYIGEHES